LRDVWLASYIARYLRARRARYYARLDASLLIMHTAAVYNERTNVHSNRRLCTGCMNGKKPVTSRNLNFENSSFERAQLSSMSSMMLGGRHSSLLAAVVVSAVASVASAFPNTTTGHTLFAPFTLAATAEVPDTFLSFNFDVSACSIMCTLQVHTDHARVSECSTCEPPWPEHTSLCQHSHASCQQWPDMCKQWLYVPGCMRG